MKCQGCGWLGYEVGLVSVECDSEIDQLVAAVDIVDAAWMIVVGDVIKAVNYELISQMSMHDISTDYYIIIINILLSNKFLFLSMF